LGAKRPKALTTLLILNRKKRKPATKKVSIFGANSTQTGVRLAVSMPLLLNGPFRTGQHLMKSKLCPAVVSACVAGLRLRIWNPL
jgi:hypothetical protein